MSIFKDNLLEGKTAMITGGGGDICRDIAKVFSGQGANVTITSRRQERLDEAAQEIQNATGGQILAKAGDVRNPEDVEAVVAATADKFGGVDILINGAAGNFPIPAAALSYNGFSTVMKIDLEGTFNCSKACFEHLLKAGEKHGNANILNITATLQYTGVPFQSHVSAAKAGIDSLTRSLANEWGPMGIRVNGIAPGPIADTEGMRRLAPTPEAEAHVNERVPLKRMGSIREITDACLFLVSDASKYTTGTILVVDGGSWLASSGMNIGGIEG